MLKTEGYIRYLEDWYGFYKSIDTKNNSNKWLIDFALDFYEKKLSQLYNQNQPTDTEYGIYETPDFDIPKSTYISTETPSQMNLI